MFFSFFVCVSLVCLVVCLPIFIHVIHACSLMDNVQLGAMAQPSRQLVFSLFDQALQVDGLDGDCLFSSVVMRLLIVCVCFVWWWGEGGMDYCPVVG